MVPSRRAARLLVFGSVSQANGGKRLSISVALDVSAANDLV